MRLFWLSILKLGSIPSTENEKKKVSSTKQTTMNKIKQTAFLITLTQHQYDLLQFSLFGRNVQLFWVEPKLLGSWRTRNGRNESVQVIQSYIMIKPYFGIEKVAQGHNSWFSYFSASRASRTLSKVSLGGPSGGPVVDPDPIDPALEPTGDTDVSCDSGCLGKVLSALPSPRTES